MERKRALAVVLVIIFIDAMAAVPVLFGVQAVSVSDDWPMFHNDVARTGYSTSTVPRNPKVLWSFNVSREPVGSDFSLSTVGYASAVSDGRVFMAAGKSVYCLNSSTGELLWNATGSQSYSYPSSFSVNDGYVYASDYPLGPLPGMPAMVAFNASTGNKTWSIVKSSGDLVVFDGYVYAGMDNFFSALNASTGETVWTKYPIQDTSHPAFAYGTVFVGSSADYSVYAFNASTGVEIWNYTTGGGITSSPAVANGRVYAYSGDGNLYAFNSSTGNEIWSHNIGGIPEPYYPYGVVSSPAVAYGMVYVGSSDYNLYALNAETGAQVWNYATQGGVYSSPAVADGVVLVCSNDANLYAINAYTGAKIWNYTLLPLSTVNDNSLILSSSPSIADGIIFIGSYRDFFYAIGGPMDISPSPTIPEFPEVFSVFPVILLFLLFFVVGCKKVGLKEIIVVK